MSNLYQLVVFIHIFSAFLMFSLWFFELLLAIKAGADSASWQPVLKYTGLLQMACMLLVFISGFYLMHKAWGPQPWLVTSVLLLLSTIPVSIVLTVLLKKEKKLRPDAQINFIPLIRSIYKAGTALVILILMVFKNAAYDQTLTIATIAYVAILLLSFRLYRTRKQPDAIG